MLTSWRGVGDALTAIDRLRGKDEGDESGFVDTSTVIGAGVPVARRDLRRSSSPTKTGLHIRRLKAL